MGDRISISFKNKYEESIAFFEHNRGLSLINDVRAFIGELNQRIPQQEHDPISRREPSWIIPLFVSWYFKRHPDNDVYLVQNKEGGDNSDNGHFTYSFETNTWDREDVP